MYGVKHYRRVESDAAIASLTSIGPAAASALNTSLPPTAESRTDPILIRTREARSSALRPGHVAWSPEENIGGWENEVLANQDQSFQVRTRNEDHA